MWYRNRIQLRTFDSALDWMHLIYLQVGCLNFFSFYFAIIIRVFGIKSIFRPFSLLSPSHSNWTAHELRMPLTYHNETNTWRVHLQIEWRLCMLI